MWTSISIPQNLRFDFIRRSGEKAGEAEGSGKKRKKKGSCITSRSFFLPGPFFAPGRNHSKSL
jgi:hypothetical protein